MPNDAAVNFLEGAYTSADAKIQWLQEMGVSIPEYLRESQESTITQTVVGDNNIQAVGDIEITGDTDTPLRPIEEEPADLQNRTTTHYLINWPGTGFNYRLQRRLSETRQLQAIREAYRENAGS